MVDDQLPTLTNLTHGHLEFAQQKGKVTSQHGQPDDEGDFWVLLLEKAYAKVYGGGRYGYKALIGHNPMNAMRRFSGCVPDCRDLDDDVPEDLFDTLLMVYQLFDVSYFWFLHS